MTTRQLFLPKESLVRVAEFLDFDGLIHLRGASKMIQKISLPILQARAMSHLQKFRRFRFKSRRRGCPDMEILLKTGGWTEQCRTLDGVIQHATRTGDLRHTYQGRNRIF